MAALSNQGAKCQCLGRRPIDVLALDNRLGAVGENALQVAVDVEAVRRGANNLADVRQGLLVDAGRVVRQHLGGQLLGGLEAVPGARGPLLGGRLVVLGLGEALLQHAPHPLLVLLDVHLGEGTLLQKLLDVDVDLGVLLLDTLVHQGLGEGRLVRLVVAVLAVADHVNDDILLVLGAPVGGHLADKVDGLDVVGVDVEDGGVDGLGNVGAVGGRAGITGIGGEADLVVDNQVDCAAG